MKSKRSGITFLEVTIVTAILLILVGVVWFAMRPQMMRGAAEAAVRNDLKQIVSAINIYMVDNDNMYPLGLKSLPKGTPRKCTAFPEDERYRAGGRGPNNYSYALPWPILKVMDKHNFQIRFDPDKHMIVRANFIVRDHGGTIPIRARNPKTGEYRLDDVPNRHTLGAKLDGSVTWGLFWDEWTFEQASYSWAMAEEFRNSPRNRFAKK